MKEAALMKKTAVLILILSLLTALCSCSKADSRTAGIFAMDTYISVSAYDAGDDTLLAATSLVSELDNALSRTKVGSDIYTLNNSGTTPVKLGKYAAELLGLALTYCDVSGGVFDITVAPLTDVWNIGSDSPQIPVTSAIAGALSLVNYKYLTISGDTAAFLYNGMSCDLGGIAKGYAADKVASLLKEKGVTSALVQIGSSIYILGKKPGGSSYTIGIRDPEGSANDWLGELQLSDRYITSSGDYERYFEAGGKRYCHIFDTSTGYPVDNELHSVTVVTDSGVEGDYLSTVLFCLGLDRGLEKCETDGIDAVFITKDRHIYVSGSVKDSFVLTNEEYSYEK